METLTEISYSSNWKKLKQTLSVKTVAENGGQKRKTARQVDNGEPRKKRRKKKREQADGAVESTSGSQKEGQPRLTKVLAMDCEFVGVGPDGMDNMLARVSLVNAHGECVYDKYVKATEPVTDYRTAVSGIREENLASGEDFEVVQKEISDLIEDRRMVGHAINHDFKVLHLSHPKKEIRDTSKYKPFRAIARTKYPSLKKLCRLILGSRIQEGEHDSICDARSAMQLYQLHKRDWEAKIRNPRAVTKTVIATDTKPVFGVQNGIRVDTRRSARYKHRVHDRTERRPRGGRRVKARKGDKAKMTKNHNKKRKV